jgi:hypothetical protein
MSMIDDMKIESAATPPADTTRGDNDFGGGALVCEKSSGQTVDSRARLACSALTKRGAVCGRTVGTRDYGEGPRCPTHKARALTEELRSPVRVLRVPGDALRLASWAAVMAAEGKIPASRANAVANACREFRRSYGDTGTLERVRRLIEQAEQDAAEFKSLRERVQRAKAKGLEV